MLGGGQETAAAGGAEDRRKPRPAERARSDSKLKFTLDLYIYCVPSSMDSESSKCLNEVYKLD